MTKVFIVDAWVTGDMEDFHTYTVVTSIEKAKDIAFEFMRVSFENVGVNDYDRAEFNRTGIDSWIDEEEREFGVNILNAKSE